MTGRYRSWRTAVSAALLAALALGFAAAAEPALAATFVSDNFTDTNGTLLSSHTGSVGATWTELPGSGTTAQIQSDAAVSTSSSFAEYYASGTPGAADYTVAFQLKKADTATMGAFVFSGPIARNDTSGLTGYECLLGDGSNIELWVGSGGSSGTVALSGGLVQNVTYTVTVGASGTTITCTVQRDSDGDYLKSDGTWQAGQTAAVTITNATYSAAGHAALYIVDNSASASNALIGKNFVAATAGGTPSMTASPSTVIDSSAGNSIALSGTNTNWTSGTPGSPTFTVSAGTITGQTVASATAATLTYTAPATIQTITITDPGESIATTIAAVSGTQNIAVTNGDLQFSPYNWYSAGAGAMQANNVHGSSTYARTSNPGAYVKFGVTVASGAAGNVSLQLDTTFLQTLTAANAPQIGVSVDGGKFTVSTPAYSSSDVSLALAAGLSAGTHQFVAVFIGATLTSSSSMGDRWNNTSNGSSVWKIDNAVIDDTASMAAPPVFSKSMIVFGDSITEGFDSTGCGNGATGCDDATYTYAALLARGLQAEYGNIGWGAGGYITNAWGNVPMLYNSTDASQSWNKYFSGQSRLVSGALSPAPNYVVVAHGKNDGTSGLAAAVTAWLSAARTAAPSAKIFVAIPFDQTDASTILSATLPDANSYFLNLGALPEFVSGSSACLWCADSEPHPLPIGAANIAALLTQKMQSDLGGTPGTVVGMLVAPF